LRASGLSLAYLKRRRWRLNYFHLHPGILAVRKIACLAAIPFYFDILTADFDNGSQINAARLGHSLADIPLSPEIIFRNQHSAASMGVLSERRFTNVTRQMKLQMASNGARMRYGATASLSLTGSVSIGRNRGPVARQDFPHLSLDPSDDLSDADSAHQRGLLSR
jgi:hypothetical protein